MAATIDLNADLGEGFGPWTMGDDDAIMQVVTSVNVACGFHAGDPLVMHRTVSRAVERGIAIGAHVGYPDLRGFGRRSMSMPGDELAADVLYQIGALSALAASVGGRVGYVKPHGALYNDMAADAGLSAVVLTAIASYDASLPILCLPGSATSTVAGELGIPCRNEGFGDRAYLDDGSLMPRSRPGAVHHDPEVVRDQVVRLATEGVVTTDSGAELAMEVATVCVHGDTPDAAAFVATVRDALAAAGVTLAPFTAL